MAVLVVDKIVSEVGGYVTIPRFVFRLPLSSGARILAGFILSEGSKDYPRDIDQQAMARELDTTPRRLRSYVSELTEHGVIEVRRRGQGRSNLYLFRVPESVLLERTDTTGQESPDGPDTTALDRTDTTAPSIEGTFKEQEDTLFPSGHVTETAPADKGKKRKPRTKKQPSNWVGRFGDKLREHAGGAPNYPALGRQLKPLLDQLGEDELWRRWCFFCETCNPEFLYASNFAKNTVKWIPRASAARCAGGPGSTPAAAPTSLDDLKRKYADRLV